MSQNQLVRKFGCGHIEIYREDSPTFVRCFKCGHIGVESTRLKCQMPKCQNPATRVVRYVSPDQVAHYCDDCTAMRELDDSAVGTEHRITAK